jgi:hypothetical protein
MTSGAIYPGVPELSPLINLSISLDIPKSVIFT